MPLALASLLARGGERVRLLSRRRSGRRIKNIAGIATIARRLMGKNEDGIPPPAPVTRGAQLVWFGDFLDPATEAAMSRISRAGIAGHLVRIVDPAEEEFPYAGRTRFEIGHGNKVAESEIFGRVERLQTAYRANFTAHGEAIAAAASRLGWSATGSPHRPRAAGGADRALRRHRRDLSRWSSCRKSASVRPGS